MCIGIMRVVAIGFPPKRKAAICDLAHKPPRLMINNDPKHDAIRLPEQLVEKPEHQQRKHLSEPER